MLQDKIGFYKKKRKNKTTYYYRYTLNGRRLMISLGCTKTITSKSQLLAKYNQVVDEVYATKKGYDISKPKIHKPVYLGEVLTRYKTQVVHKAKTFHSYFYEFKTFVVYFGSESDWDTANRTINPNCKIDITKITTKDLNDYYKSQIDAGKSDSTIQKRKNYLAPFYRWLVGEEYLERDHHSYINSTKTNKKAFEFKALDYAIIRQVIDNAPNQFCKLLWSIMAYTGLDCGDALTLDKDKDVLVIDGLPHIITKRSKSKIMARIPIFPPLQKLGDSIYNIFQKGNLSSHVNKSNKAWKKTLIKLGVDISNKKVKTTQKSIRHSFITYLESKGVSDEKIALYVGHSNTKIQKRYKDLTLVPETDFTLFN